MLSASFCYLAGQIVAETDLWDASLAAESKRPLEEVLTLLRKGALLLKHGRQGKPKVHFFRLATSDTILRWRSASGSMRQVKLRTVNEVVAGQTTEVFKRHMLREAALSFSLKYTDDDGSHRTLDLTCSDAKQYAAWYTGLRVVAARLRVTGTPAVPAATAVAARLNGGSFSILSSTDLTRSYGGGTAMGRASGVLGIPVVEHVPGDLLAWGAASRGTAVVASTRSGMADVEAWHRSKAPMPLKASAALDVRCAAVGQQHGILVTSSGVAYSWGQGRGGKLGLGHDQDTPTPHRLEAGLLGQGVVAVACGDDCTAAITDAGTLFMWGRLASGSRPQLVPLPVRGELHNRPISKVACGPFHCAAVSADGALFTWGEGFGGKLGHGDQSCRAQPTLVQALLGRQVLGVACGVWHTAAVVVEVDGPLAQAAQVLARAQSVTASPGKPGEHMAGNSYASPAELSALSDSAALSASHHRRNSSTSSVLSEGSCFHEGQGGTLYTWGGVNESVVYGSSEKRDSNKGCLGHGDADVSSGQLLPTRVSGALEGKSVRYVAAGLHLTVAVTTGGRVFQMGATGAPPGRHCPWEGATSPEIVKGPLAAYFVDQVACGTHHVLALARPMDRKHNRPVDHGSTAVFAWGRGAEGQLGTGKLEDSAAPLLVDALKGRQVLQVVCGGNNTMVVCEHDARRYEPESKEAVEEAMAAFGSMMDSKPAKALRAQSSEGYAQGSMNSMTMRARSMTLGGNAGALVPYSQSGRAASVSSKVLGGGSRPPTIAEAWGTMRSMQRQVQQMQRSGSGSRRGVPALAHNRTDPTPHAASNGGALPLPQPGPGAGGNGGAPPRVLGVPHFSHGSGAASRRGMGVSASMPSLSGVMAMAHTDSWGGRSELSSAASMRQHSEDWSEGDDSQRTNSAAMHGQDLAAIDEAASISSLNEELQEKNRMIETLENKLQQMRRQSLQLPNRDAEERLRQSVRASAGQFRESFHDWSSVRSMGSRSLGRPSMTLSEAGTSVAGCGYGGDEEGSVAQEASMRSMEAQLARRLAGLESQEAQLRAWAAELQRREEQLQHWQAVAEGRPYTAPHHGSPMEDVPAPIPSESPVMLRRQNSGADHASARAGAVRTAPAAVASLADRTATAQRHGEEPPWTPSHLIRPGSAADVYSMGTPAPGTAENNPAEWMEEIETGVFVTYTVESGARKLKRIRFSRNVFSKESAAKWYEANKHRLGQPSGTPRVARDLSSSHGLHRSPSPAGRQQRQPPATAPSDMHAASALVNVGRMGSRSMSFDPRELAELQHQGSGSAAMAAAAAAAGTVLHAPAPGPAHRSQQPSRLSQVSRPCTAPGMESGPGWPVAAAAAGEGQASPPPSPFAAQQAGRQSPGAENAADGQSSASQQLSQMPSEVLSASTLYTMPSGMTEAGAEDGSGSRRGSPRKQRASSHHQQLAKQGSLMRAGSSLTRDLSRSSLSSVKTAATDASRGSAQPHFSPRFAALERKPSPQAATISAVAAVAVGAVGAPPAAESSLSTPPGAAVGPAVAAAGAASATPRTPASQGGDVNPAQASSASPSRFTRLKQALKGGGSSSKKKERQ